MEDVRPRRDDRSMQRSRMKESLHNERRAAAWLARRAASGFESPAEQQREKRIQRKSARKDLARKYRNRLAMFAQAEVGDDHHTEDTAEPSLSPPQSPTLMPSTPAKAGLGAMDCELTSPARGGVFIPDEPTSPFCPDMARPPPFALSSSYAAGELTPTSTRTRSTAASPIASSPHSTCPGPSAAVQVLFAHASSAPSPAAVENSIRMLQERVAKQVVEGLFAHPSSPSSAHGGGPSSPGAPPPSPLTMLTGRSMLSGLGSGSAAPPLNLLLTPQVRLRAVAAVGRAIFGLPQSPSNTAAAVAALDPHTGAPASTSGSSLSGGAAAASSSSGMRPVPNLFAPWRVHVTPRFVHALVHALPLEALATSPRLLVLRATYEQFSELRDVITRAAVECLIAVAAQGAGLVPDAPGAGADDATGEAAGAGLRSPTSAPAANVLRLIELLSFLVAATQSEQSALRTHMTQRIAAAGRMIHAGSAAGGAHAHAGSGSASAAAGGMLPPTQDELSAMQALLQSLQHRAQLIGRALGFMLANAGMSTTLTPRLAQLCAALSKLSPPATFASLQHVLTHWPRADGLHEGSLLCILKDLLPLLPLPMLPQAAPRTHALLCRRVALCAASPNAQVARHAVELLSAEHTVTKLYASHPSLLKTLVTAVHAASAKHWNEEVRAAAEPLFDELLDMA